MLTFRRLIAIVSTAGLASTSTASVIASGYIADSYTQFAPFSNALGQYVKTGGGTLQDGVIYADFSQAIPNYPSRYGTAISGGGPGFVHCYSYTQYILNTNPNPNPGSYYIRAEADAEATWTDVVVSGPAGATTVPVSVNLLINGSFQFSCSTVTDPHNVGWTNYSSASFGIRINGQGAAGGNWGVRSDSSGPVVNPLANGIFENFTGTFEGATETVMVPVNTPFSIQMFLQTNAQINLPIGGALNIATSTDFAHTASFATNKPAFNVPEGYTVNSAEAGVVDNAFVLVPAPASLALAPVVGVYAAHRRRTR